MNSNVDDESIMPENGDIEKINEAQNEMEIEMDFSPLMTNNENDIDKGSSESD